MLFSWNQLTDYLRLTIPHDELADRLSLVGFNHESTREVGGDLCIDLEITSNRPDTLNHLGIAREIGLLLGQEVRYPRPPEPRLRDRALGAVAVENLAPDLCSQYQAITIHGVKVGPSPWWLAKRLETLGLRPINNVVDVTNYVMHESGQPIHAYDLAKLAGRKLVVRRAHPGEAADCLDHKQYKLDGVHARHRRRRPPRLHRRGHGLHRQRGRRRDDRPGHRGRPVRPAQRPPDLACPRPPKTQSSYRFERQIDPLMLLWARNRCVDLILRSGGGSVGTVAGHPPTDWPARTVVTLRVDRVARLLGIEVPRDEIRRILVALGLVLLGEDDATMTFETPIWRSDLDREVDLIEEVGRVHDYAKIPEDRPVTLGAIRQDRRGRVEGEIRGFLTSLGASEAITYSFVPRDLVGAEFLPEPAVEPIRVEHATRKQANLMRLALTPSLLEAASYNEAHGNLGVHLFEVGHVYHPVSGQDLPDETHPPGARPARRLLPRQGGPRSPEQPPPRRRPPRLGADDARRPPPRSHGGDPPGGCAPGVRGGTRPG